MAFFSEAVKNYSGTGSIINFSFALDGINQVTDSTIYELKIPLTAYVTAASIKLDTQRTGGTLQIQLLKNGTLLTGTSLNLELNESYPLDYKKVIQYGLEDYKFAENDILQVNLTTTDFAPLYNVGIIGILLK